jgi:hypothetical protein
MARTITRTTKETPIKVDLVVKKVQQFLSLKHEIAFLTGRQNALKDSLMKEVEENGEPDEKGSLFLTLHTPVTVEDQTFSVLKRERRVSQFFKADEATALLEAKGLLAEATTIPEPEPYLDQDKIYILLQEEKLTEAEVDSMFGESVSWAFKPLAS